MAENIKTKDQLLKEINALKAKVREFENKEVDRKLKFHRLM